MPLSAENIKRLHTAKKNSISIRGNAFKAIEKAKNVVSPVEVQVAFLKALVENKEEADKFLKNPKEYSLKHRVVLDPDVVGIVTKSVVFKDIPEDKIKNWPEEAVNEMLGPGSVAAWPAAVAAGAAVVAAAAAVVTMVVTLVRSKRPQDLRVLTELGARNIREIALPGGRIMKVHR